MQHCRQMVGYFWIKLPGKPGIPGCLTSPTKSEASEPHLLNRYDGGGPNFLGQTMPGGDHLHQLATMRQLVGPFSWD